jgi:hypothetical protein
MYDPATAFRDVSRKAVGSVDTISKHLLEFEWKTDKMHKERRHFAMPSVSQIPD